MKETCVFTLKRFHAAAITLIAVVLFMPAMLWLLPGCSQEPAARNAATPAAAPPLAAAPHGLDPARMARGAEIYKQHCASCHGAMAQGASNWQRPGADGKYPAPPLDGSGHAWHHPRVALKKTIRDGTLGLGGSMPAWGNKLSEDDIEAVIVWFQSRWPEEIYRNWLAMEQKARSGQAAH